MDIHQVNLEILKMAKELVLNEYIDRRAELHNQWVAQSDLLWKTRGIKLNYPTIPPYPTEQDICERATKLLQFLETPHPSVLADEQSEDVETNVDEIVRNGDTIVVTGELSNSTDTHSDKQTHPQSLLNKLKQWVP